MAKVTRIYDSHEKAADAAARLKEAGYTDQQIEISALPDEHAPHAVDEGTDTRPAPTSETAVTVEAPFGWAQTATEILDSFGPVRGEIQASTWSRGFGSASGRTASAYAGAGRAHDNAAPLSSALGLPVLKPFETSVRLMPDATPLSNKFGWRVLINDTPKAKLLSSDWLLSDMLGLKLLSSDPAPLSTATGRTVLIDDPAPLSRKAKWRLLLEDPTPLSSALKLKVLTDRQ